MTKTLLVSIVCILTVQVFAQEMLDTVTVTANRAHSDLQSATRTVTVMTENDINNTPAFTNSETIESFSALDVRQRGPLDVQSDISVRGGTFDQTLVLLNGIRINDPQTGHHNMNLPITFNLIEQVEVLEGGASRVYGPNAFSGAVNFQTPTQGKNNVSATLLGGQNGLFMANANGAINTGNWYTLASINHAQSAGYMRNSDFVNNNVYLQTAGQFNIGTLLISAGMNSKAFGAQNFYTSAYPDQFEATKTLFGSVKLTGGNIWKYTALAYWRQHNDRFELFREGDDFYQQQNGFWVNPEADTIPSWYSGPNYHRTRVTGAEGNVKRTWKKAGTTTIGFDYRNEQIVSNNLGKDLDEPLPVPDTDAEYDKADARDNYSVYVEHTATIKRFLFTVGALFNYNSAFGQDIMPGIDLGYRVGASTMVYASVDRSFRLPTFTDLYYSLGGAQGSETLQPEYSLNYEAGVRYTKGNLGFDAAVFRREGKDMIDWVMWKPDSVHAENLTEVNMNGFTLSTTYNLAKQTNGLIKSMDAGYTFLYSEQNEEDQDVQSIYVLDFLTHKLYFGITHKLFLDNLSANWRLRYQARNGTYDDFESGMTVAYTPFMLIDARVNYKVSQFDLFVQVSNLLDAQYVDRGNVPQPGNWVSGGITWTLNPKK